jgi:hypothetical protein
MKLQDCLHLYLKIWGTVSDSTHEKYINGEWALSCDVLKAFLMRELKFTPHLKPLSNMTEEEMIGLLLAMIPADLEDAPDADEHILEMFYNDGGNYVDADVAVGANYSVRCYEGQIAIGENGGIEMFDEEGKREKVWNQSVAFYYLLSHGFDLFSLIENGLALDATKISEPKKDKE